MEVQIIQNKIYEIRGCKVMLDFDLAEMYQVETKRLNETVKRNIKRFPPDFMFKLTSIEYNFLRSQIATLENQTPFDGRGKYSKYLPTAFTQEELSRSQIVTLNKGRGSNIKYLPFAFTELGVAMLSSVLRSDVAIEINRGIMRAFVTIRQLTSLSPLIEVKKLQHDVVRLQQLLEEVFSDQNDINEDTRMQLELINNTLAALQAKNSVLNKPRKAIGFKTNNT